MINESKVMKELHDIRLKNYEATKNMSNSEFIEYMNAKARKAREHLEEQKKAKV